MIFKRKKEPVVVVPLWFAATSNDMQIKLSKEQIDKVNKNFPKDSDHVPIKYYSLTGIGWNVYAERDNKKIEITDYKNW